MTSPGETGRRPECTDEQGGVVTDEGFSETRRSMERAIRRLNALEYGFLIAAALLALLGGAVVARLLIPDTVPFWLSWTAISLLLFVIPAVGVSRQEAGRERQDRERDEVDDERKRGEADGG